MCRDHSEEKTYIEKLNLWFQIFAIILGGAWVIYEFFYKEIWIPNHAPVHICSEIIISNSGKKKINDQIYSAIQLTFRVKNTGKKKAVFLPSTYFVWGHKIMETRSDPKFISTINSIFQEYEKIQDYHCKKYLCDSKESIIAAGEIFSNWYLDPLESAQRSTIIYVSTDKYDFLEAKAQYPIVNEENIAYCTWLVKEEKNSVDYKIFKILSNNELKEIDMYASEGSDKEFLKNIQYGVVEEYEFFSLWHQIEKADRNIVEQQP